MILNAHPLYNAWSLANEPAVGEAANCIMQTMDVFVPAPRTDTKASGEESRPTRTAKEVAKTRMSECVEELGVAIVVLVQVRPSADGILTVRYGDTFVRDYECGNAPSPCYVTQRELLEFIGDRCNDDYEVARRLLLYGAPLNKGTADLAKEWQDQGPLQPTMRTANGELGAPASIPALDHRPERSALGSRDNHILVEEEPQAESHEEGSTLDNPILVASLAMTHESTHESGDGDVHISITAP